jgi:hypothetical protein
MPDGNIAKHAVARLTCGIKYDPDVHHDVDEQRIFGDK